MILDLFFGDAKLQMDTNSRSEIKWQNNNTPSRNLMRQFEITIPYKNTGTQELTILDAWVRVYLPDEQYNCLHLSSKVNDSKHLREDDYFEAMLVGAGKEGTLVLRFTAIARNTGTEAKNYIDEAINNCPECDVAVYCECRGRKEVYIDKQIFTLKLH